MKRGHKKKNKIPKFLPDFIQVPYQVFSDEKLSSTDKFVYGAIYFFYNTTIGKKCTASNETIGDLIKTTATTVSNSLVILEDRKCIKRVFFDEETHRRRKEIIPLVVVTKLIKNKLRDTPQSGTLLNKSNTPQSGTNTPQSGTNTPQSGTLLKKSKNANNDLYKAQSDHFDGKRDTPQSGERENKREYQERKNKKDLFLAPSAPQQFNKNVKETIGKKVNDVIALFLPLFPGDFIGSRTAFAKPPTREAVESLMKRYSFEQIKELIQKYSDGKTDPYRPQSGTVYEFCTIKLAKIESYVVKTGGLWAQRSISTPEQRADSDEIMRKLAERDMEQQRKDKEEWNKTHLK